MIGESEIDRRLKVHSHKKPMGISFLVEVTIVSLQIFSKPLTSSYTFRSSFTEPAEISLTIAVLYSLLLGTLDLVKHFQLLSQILKLGEVSLFFICVEPAPDRGS